MNDDSRPLQNRLRMLNRGILVAGILVLIALAIAAFIALRKPAQGVTTTVVSSSGSAPGASAPAAPGLAATASAASAAASGPKQPTVVEASAAAAMQALAASAPAPRASGAEANIAPPASMPVPVEAPHEAAAPAESQPVAPAVVKPEPKTAATAKPHHREAAAKRKATAKHERVTSHAGLVAGLPSCATPGWYVQIGAFSNEASIRRMAHKLRGLGYQAFCIGPDHPQNLQLFYVGAYVSANAARAARDKLHQETGTRGILRHVTR